MTGHQLVLEATSELDRRFRAWLDENPHVLDEFIRLAREWKAAGHRRGSAALFAEVLRYERGLTTTGDTFKVNNSFRAPLVREVEKAAPDLEGFFAKRVRRNGA